jgi:hypothetical protein
LQDVSVLEEEEWNVDCGVKGRMTWTLLDHVERPEIRERFCFRSGIESRGSDGI